MKIRSVSEVTKLRPVGSTYSNFFVNVIVRSFTKVKQKLWYNLQNSVASSLKERFTALLVIIGVQRR